MFDRNPPQPEQEKAKVDYSPHFYAMNDSLDQILKMLKRPENPPKYVMDQFDGNARTFDSKGYRYVGIFVSATQTVTVTFAGLTYSLPLNPGINRLNLVDGAQINSSIAFPFTWYYADHPIVEDTESVGVTGTANVQVTASTIMQPVDLQNRLTSTIQTHNAVAVSPSTASIPSTWMDCNGFDQLALTLKNDASSNFTATIYWSNDNSNIHGSETAVNAVVGSQFAARTPIKARYAKVAPYNNDTVSHTISAWSYLLS